MSEKISVKLTISNIYVGIRECSRCGKLFKITDESQKRRRVCDACKAGK